MRWYFFMEVVPKWKGIIGNSHWSLTTPTIHRIKSAFMYLKYWFTFKPKDWNWFEKEVLSK